MTLTQKDIERIEGLGYSRDDFVVQAEDGFLELRNIDGLCFFYDPENRECRIYVNRPEGCRYYPVVYDAQERRCVVDRDCPSWETMDDATIARLCPEVTSLVETLMREAAQNER
ncbi:YkgJ family cysteine cluster protein [Candidatus Thorarchaeota archaeon]|nr:MAG: YkgJ family cysteine cluster protein [Candidatus Thorarchaeota archaeon]